MAEPEGVIFDCYPRMLHGKLSQREAYPQPRNRWARSITITLSELRRPLEELLVVVDRFSDRVGISWLSSCLEHYLIRIKNVLFSYQTAALKTGGRYLLPLFYSDYRLVNVARQRA